MPAVRRPKIVSVPIIFEDGLVINVTFDRNRLTMDWADSVQNEDTEMAQSLAAVISAWDVTNDDGTPLEISAKAIGSNFDVWDLRDLTEQIGKAARPSSEEGNDLGNISSSPSTTSFKQPENLPNGQQPSTLPIASESPLPR
jgi:hypothetical protein